MMTGTRRDDRPRAAGIEVVDRIHERDPLFADIHEFLTDEAALLDDNLLGEWLELLAEDITYRAPLRQTVMRNQGNGFHPTMGHFDDDVHSLGFRVHRFLDSTNAFADDPPSRTRRNVSNVAAWTTSRDGEYFVRSNLLLLRSRWDAPAFDVISARREDVVRLRDEPRLAQRTIYLDQSTLGTPNLAVFL
jgi:3-phenylpropionate/cinnamic acid dioxygenase small subunit